PGTSCDDGDTTTGDDVYGNNCVCAGLLIDCENVPGGPALPTTPCDDNDPNTINDTWSAICTCEGSSGIGEAGSITGFSVFPNPTRDAVTLTISTTYGAPTSILLRDAVGRIVYGKDLGTVGGERMEIIDMSALARGVYTVQVMHGTSASIMLIAKF
ncbi:MAG: T9SS type A sorting domain-containing protein, partial [Flavobacteriales bacterium]